MVECLNVVKSLILINAFLKGWVSTFFKKNVMIMLLGW